MLYPRPIVEWSSLSHDKISQSPPSFSCYLIQGVHLGRYFYPFKLLCEVDEDDNVNFRLERVHREDWLFESRNSR